MPEQRRTITRNRLGYRINVFWGSNRAWCFWVYAPTSEQVACGTAETFHMANMAADQYVDEAYRKSQALLNQAREEEGLPYMVHNVIREEAPFQEGSQHEASRRVYFNHR